MTNADKLRALKKKHGLTNAKLAEITEYSEVGVEQWLAAPESARYRDLKDRVFRDVKNTVEAWAKKQKK